jgi:hypothetical protein
MSETLNYLKQLKYEYQQEILEHRKNVGILQAKIEVKEELTFNLTDAIKTLEQELKLKEKTNAE